MGGLLRRTAHSSGYDDDRRFSLLYEATSPDLLAFLLRRCRTADAAADCLAETYRIAWEKRSRIPAGDQARPWLFGVARNVMRREVADNERSAATVRALALAADRAYAVADPQDSAVMSALSSLSPVDQEIVTMLSWDGLAPREVASILGLSSNVVRVRAHRARERLRMLLSQPNETECPASADAGPVSCRRSV